MKEKRMRRAQLLALLWVLVAAAAVTAATYAWFTFSPYTNVEPMSSTISQGDISLLISNTSDGDFDISCTLTPDSNPSELNPLTTSDLEHFYTAAAQNQDGITVLYQDVTEQMGESAIHGTVYLQSKNGGCDVYLYRTGMDFGQDVQALASLRLGLKITAQSGTATYIFRLDDMSDVSSAGSTRTVPTSGTVVSSVSDQGTASYVEDPSVGFESYFAKESGENDSRPSAGTDILTTLEEDEIASVEYWLYLEGCDDNCANAVQNRDIALQLAFAGVAREE